MKGNCVYMVKICFALQKNFTLLTLKMQLFVFLLLQLGRCKEAPAFLFHTNSLFSCSALLITVSAFHLTAQLLQR